MSFNPEDLVSFIVQIYKCVVGEIAAKILIFATVTIDYCDKINFMYILKNKTKYKLSIYFLFLLKIKMVN